MWACVRVRAHGVSGSAPSGTRGPPARPVRVTVCAPGTAGPHVLTESVSESVHQEPETLRMRTQTTRIRVAVCAHKPLVSESPYAHTNYSYPSRRMRTQTTRIRVAVCAHKPLVSESPYWHAHTNHPHPNRHMRTQTARAWQCHGLVPRSRTPAGRRPPGRRAHRPARSHVLSESLSKSLH